MLIDYLSEWRTQEFACPACGGTTTGDGLVEEAAGRTLALRCPTCDRVVATARRPGEAAAPRAEATSTILRRSYTIERWSDWDHELHSFTLEFIATFGVSPNILLASDVTLSRIDLAAAKENVVGPDGERPGPDEYAPLESFAGPGYSMFLALDDRLPDRRVSLLHDPDPDGGGEEPVPDEDTPLVESGCPAAHHRREPL